MQEAFEALAPNYEALIAAAHVALSRVPTIDAAVARLLRDADAYAAVEKISGVPTAALMALAEREMDGNLSCYLGNGQPLRMRTTIVPRGRGPFTGPNAFVAGCMDALTLDGLTRVPAWTLARFCYESEAWNGWGYRARGLPSPYVFGATTVQRPGKFVCDHVFDAHEMDPQIGTLALVLEIARQAPGLQFWTAVAPAAAPSIVPDVDQHPHLDQVDAAWVQRALNKLGGPFVPLTVDDNYGRATARAVRRFQATHHVAVDGVCGPLTVAAIKRALAEAGQ